MSEEPQDGAAPPTTSPYDHELEQWLTPLWDESIEQLRLRIRLLQRMLAVKQSVATQSPS